MIDHRSYVPAPGWLDSSGGESASPCHIGHGFKPHSSLIFFFQALFSQLCSLFQLQSIPTIADNLGALDLCPY